MSRIPFKDHPLDVQHSIMETIDSPKDLLSLALSSKHYYQLIVPYHLQFRILRCSVQRTHVWTKLSTKKHLCSRFRRLEITHRFQPRDSEDFLIFPACLEDETSDSNEYSAYLDHQHHDETQRKSIIDKIVEVCRSMWRIQEFHWIDDPKSNDTLRQPFTEILSVIVQSSASLQSIEVLPTLATSMENTLVCLRKFDAFTFFWS